MKSIKKEMGRSMIEIIGVLAIIGVLSIGGISGYSKAMRKYKENKAIDQISNIFANIRSIFTNQGSFDNLNNAFAIKFDIVPQDMIKNGDELVNPFGGDVVISGNDDNDRVIVQYGGIDKQACISIVTADWGGTASSGLFEMKIGSGGNGNAMNYDKIYNWKNDGLPISLQVAQNACKENENAISWEYDWLSY